MKEFDEIPFVPCNDCTSWESCTQDAYEEGKAEAKAEHDKECDRCQYSLRKETIEEVREEARKQAIIDTLTDVVESLEYYANQWDGAYQALDVFKDKLEEHKECCTCKNLMFSDCYGECTLGGIVNPHDSCDKWGKKNE